ncbi:MAG: MoaD/ThiS family protein [Proteobacteria bacterium]|nr:MoaD/ThiS family protein [Pseudomonadota bacterium]
MTRILFFGRVSDAAGCSEITTEIPRELRTVGDVRDWLAARDDALAPVILSPTVRAAVDRVFCSGDADLVVDAEEIAFMSPLSGG